jgi:hypothetical protein
VTRYDGPLLDGSDPHGAGPAASRVRTPERAATGGQDLIRSPTDLREQASRLIEACDPEAALRAARLYVQEANRVFAEAAHQFSEAGRMAAQAAADQQRLAYHQHEMERERHRLEARTRELEQAVNSVALRKASLEALESELMAQKEAQENDLLARKEAMENEFMAQKKARRRQAEATPPPKFADTGPLDLRPYPHEARTSRELLECLTQFRVWSGNRSLRQIAEQSGDRISASSVRNILSGSALPDRLEVLDAIVLGCGGSEDDRAEFTGAWRRLYMTPPDGPGTDAAPIRNDFG